MVAMHTHPHQRPIRVLYIIFGLAMGGAETVLFELINGLDRKEFQPVVLSLSPPAALSEKFAAAGIEVHYLTLKRLEQAPLTLLRAIRTARQLNPDILQGVLFYGDLTARLIRLVWHKPLVVSAVHSTGVGRKPYLYAMRYTDGLTDAVTAVSRAVADAHLAERSITREKTTVIANGIDVQRFARPPESELVKLRQRFSIPEGRRVVLCVGRLDPVKNHALLLRAFAGLTRSVPNICLLLAGGGRIEGELRAQVAELGLGEQVIFAGEVYPIDPLFHLADVFVLSSSREGLPMVVLEAMAAGSAIVCTKVGGIPEVISSGKNGILVPSEDQPALERALRELLEAPESERRRLGDQAKVDVIEQYGTARMVEQTARLYRSLLARAS